MINLRVPVWVTCSKLPQADRKPPTSAYHMTIALDKHVNITVERSTTNRMIEDRWSAAGEWP